MRTPILLLSISLFLFSCSHYQYLTLASDDTPTNERYEFVAETDSLRVIYNFSGLRGPVQISIYNKSAEGFQIDWRRSALIVGDTPYVYYNPDISIEGSTEGSAFRDRRQSITATLRRQQGREFIPPSSRISQADFYVAGPGSLKIDLTTLREEKIRTNWMSQKIRKGDFDKFNSPLVFRSYLTFVAGSDESRTFTMTSSFYVSQLIDSYEQLGTEFYGQNGNRFYTR